MDPQTATPRSVDPFLDALVLSKNSLKPGPDRDAIARQLSPLVLEHGAWTISLYRNFARRHEHATALTLTRSLAKLVGPRLAQAAACLDGGTPSSFSGIEVDWLCRDWIVSGQLCVSLGPGARAVFGKWREQTSVNAKPLTNFFERLGKNTANRTFRTVQSALVALDTLGSDRTLSILASSGPQSLCNIDLASVVGREDELVKLSQDVKGFFRPVIRALGHFALQLDPSTRAALCAIWMHAERQQSVGHFTNLVANPSRTRQIVEAAADLVPIVENYGVSILELKPLRAISELGTDSSGVGKTVADTLASKDALHEIGETLVRLDPSVDVKEEDLALYKKTTAIFPPISRWISGGFNSRFAPFVSGFAESLDVYGMFMLPKIPIRLLEIDNGLVKALLKVSIFENGKTVSEMRPDWFAGHRAELADLVHRRGSVGIALLRIFGEDAFGWECRYNDTLDEYGKVLSQRGLRELLLAVPHTLWNHAPTRNLIDQFKNQSAWAYRNWKFAATDKAFIWYHDLSKECLEALGITSIAPYLSGKPSAPDHRLLRQSIAFKTGRQKFSREPIIVATARDPDSDSLATPLFWGSVDRLRRFHDVAVCEVAGTKHVERTFNRWQSMCRSSAAGVVIHSHGDSAGPHLRPDTEASELYGSHHLTPDKSDTLYAILENIRRGGRLCFSACLGAFRGVLASNIVTTCASIRPDITVEGSRTITSNGYLTRDRYNRFNGMYMGYGNRGKVVISPPIF